MDNKFKIIILIIVIAIIFAVLYINKKKNNTEIESNNINSVVVNSSFDEETGLYYIRDTNNEIVAASDSKEGMKIYEEHPDYNPNPLAPKSTNLYDFVDMSEEDSIEE